MPYQSILYRERRASSIRPVGHDPACFRDLNLDQFVDSILIGKEQYNLRPFFQQNLEEKDDILYRQAVMRDLDGQALFRLVEAFANGMHTIRDITQQSEKLYYKLQGQRHFLLAVTLYCDSIKEFAKGLRQLSVVSDGFKAFRAYVEEYVLSDHFRTLERDAIAVKEALERIRYAVTVNAGGLKVRAYEDEEDYSATILRIFDKFRETEGTNNLIQFPDRLEMNDIEARILGFVAKLNPEAFDKLEAFVTRHANFLDRVLTEFDREVQFYIAYLSAVRRIELDGLKFCYPEVSRSKSIRAVEAFDIALAGKLLAEKRSVVTNDFELAGDERIFLVSGPNQGGKTTFARTFGQMHFLASLGCSVPAREAELFIFDEVFTHFEREERAQDLRGKLEDELVRVHDILQHVTSRSIVIMNEIFASTTLTDATFLARSILADIRQDDLLCVCVTFLTDLVSVGSSVVSMVTAVAPDGAAERTFKIERRPPDGRSYALSLAEKYGLTTGVLRQRLSHPAQ